MQARPPAMSVGPPLELTEQDPPDVCAALLRAAAGHPCRGVVAVTAPDTAIRIDYPELLLRARRMLTGLRARGCRTGDAVVLYGLSLPTFFPAYWACLLGGLRPAAIATPSEDRLAHVCRLLGDPLVLTDDNAVLADTPADDLHIPSPDEVALLMLSSGSTSLPKVVQLTHRGLAEFAASTRRVLDVRPEHVTLNWMPLDHSGAFLIYHLLGVFVGCDNVHAPTDLVLADPLRWLDLAVEHRANHIWAPNFAYPLVTDAMDRRWDLSTVSTVVSGGEQVTVPAVTRFLAATGLPAECFRPAWGMAETTTGVTFGRFTVCRVLKSSVDGDLVFGGADEDCLTLVPVGPPAPGVAVRVVGEDGLVVPEGRIGRLQVRSPRVTPGYLGDEEATRAAFPDHERTGRTWLDSGDLAFLTDGEVVITGRAKDLIILNGHNYFCHEIEDVVASVPGLTAGKVAACGVPNERTGSEDLYVFVATDDPAPLAGAIRAALFERLGLSGCQVVAVPELPVTPSGKIQRARLRDRTLPGRVRAAVAEVLGRDVDPRTPFYELGLTSVTLMRVRGLLERELGREIPRTALFRYPTVTALADHLAGSSSAAVVNEPRPTSGRVAIIGMALRFPGADSPEEFWTNLRAGVDSVRRFTPKEMAAAGVPDRAGNVQPVAGALADVDGFDASFFGISPREASLTDPAHRLFLECCFHALEHAGYAGDGEQRIGVFAGSGMHLYGHQDEPAGGPGFEATIGSEPDFLATRVAYRLGLTGPAIGVRTACSTSLVAVHLAAQAVLSGDAELALAGAAAVRVPQEAGYVYEPGSVLSPTGRCRAFDAESDGTVGGNGVAAVLLKPLEAALADGDTVHAVILGSAVNNDGTAKVGFAAPSVPGQVAVIRAALRRADVPASSVSYVETHGTGTELGDPVEFDALCEAFAGVRPGSCTLGSVKPNIGHLDSCAGMAGLIKVALMLRHGELVPTINLTSPNPALPLDGSPFVLGTSGGAWTGELRRAGVSAFGVGGTNAHVILEEPPAPVVPPADRRPVLVPLSAPDPSTLRDLASSVRAHLQANPSLSPADVATTLSVGRRHLPHRLCAVGTDLGSLAEELVCGDPAPPLGRLVFVFSGQDGVRPGMATSLYETFPAVRSVLDECERVHPGLLAQLTGGEVREQQPVLFALQAAQVELWRAAGIEPDAVAGHSLGEYAALYAAGGMSLADGVRITAARESAMRATEPGGMVLLNCEVTVAQRIAASTGTFVAAMNGPTVQVLSGSVSAVATAASVAAAEGIVWLRLEAERAFHSPLIEPALDELSGVPITWHPLRLPMISGVDGETHPPGWRPNMEYLRRQAREPVDFTAVLSTVDSTCEDAVELGPGEPLTSLGRRFSAVRWHPTQRRRTEGATAFLTAAGTLYRQGAPMNWEALNPKGRRIPLPVYPFRRDRSPDALEEIRHLTASCLGIPPTAVDPDQTFITLGGDSLSLLTMTRELEEAFSTRVPIRSLFEDVDTPRKLAAQVGSGASRRETAKEQEVEERRGILPGQGAEERDAAREGVGVDGRLLGAEVEAVRRRGVGGEWEAEARSLDEEIRPAERSAADTRSATVSAKPESVAAASTQAESGELRSIVDRQLGLAERLVDRVTSLMSEQLAALSGQRPAPAVRRPAPVSEPVRSPVPVLPAAASSPVCDFSLYFFGDYPDEGQADKYRLVTDAARFADQHGFHAVWLPERHFHSFGALFPNPSVLAAALAVQTERIRLHAGSVVLPLHHPVRVAEEWSVVDNLSGGRVGLCVASGWHAADFVLAPENFGEHREITYARLDTVRRLWAGETVTATGGGGETVDVRIQPRPVQPQPPMYVAVVGNPDSYVQAAVHDLGVVTNLMAQDLAQLSENIALYRRVRAERGLDSGRVVVLLHTYLGDDLDLVRQEAFAPFCAYLRSSLSLFDQVTTSLGVDIDLQAASDEDVEFLLGQAYRRYCESRALIGTVDSCASVVDELRAAGVDEIACFVDFGVEADRVLGALSTLDELRVRFQQQPLTPAERRIWFLDRLYPGQTIYHEPKAIRLDGPVNLVALRWALRRVVDRQPALRTIFPERGGEPYKVVTQSTMDLPVEDHDGALYINGTHDLAAGPLVTARLARISDEQHLLLLSAHHIVFDSASTAVFVRDLAAYYRSWPAEPELPPLSAIQPPAAHRQEDVEYWKAKLAGAPTLQLPTDRPRPPTRTGLGAAMTHELDTDLVTGLRALTQDAGVTMFMAMLGALAAVLGRFGAQDDLVLGTAVSHRSTNDRIGLFLDTVPLRVDLSGDPSFPELARRVLRTTTDALEHRAVPFDELVAILNPQRDSSRNPLFEVMVEFENAAEVDFDPPALTATILDVPAARAPFDLSFYLTHHVDGLRISVEYDTALFDASTVRRLLDHLSDILKRAVSSSEASLSGLSTEDQQNIARWRGAPRPAPPCLHQLVEAQVDRTPDATALVAGDVELTYRDLDEHANKLANWLLAKNIGRGGLVAVRLDRGPALIATLLGALKSGAAYLPLDPGLPQARVDLMVADSGASLVITAFPADADDPSRPAVPVDPDDLAYCIYTSGSSGRPKGVLVPHRGPANVVRWQTAQHEPLRTLQWTSPAFDVSVQEIFSTLAAGSALVLIDDEVRYDPSAVAELARKHHVQRIFMPYTPLKYLLETRPHLPELRVVVSAGEPLVLTSALREFFATHQDCLLYNQYGPTEGSIIVTSHQVDVTDGDRPAIGAPIDGVTVDILDQRSKPVPVGAVGEIHIGGLAVANGYLGRPEETSKSFVDGRYRTGDHARWRADGTIEFLGRRDDQVKIRGYRVEPGETERVLCDQPGVRDAAVVVRHSQAGEPELVAYVVGTDVDTLATRLNAVLPRHLLPHHWVALDRLPVTPNGKLDRANLPEPRAQGAAPTTPIEETLHELWCAELGHSDVPVDRSFFALGGHSLSAVRLLNRIVERLGSACSMSDFFRNPTIRALAQHLHTDVLPLTSTQRRLLRRHRARTNPAVYNVVRRVELRGDLDPAALQRAVEAVVHRHAALRTRVVDQTQEVLAPFPVPLPVEEVADVDRWCQEIAAEPFVLDVAPLFRARLARCGPGHWVFVLALHHMVCDGVSLGIVWRDLGELYAGRTLPAATPYADYVRETLTPHRRAALTTFWRTELAGLSEVDIMPRMPTDRPRPDRLSGRGALHESTLPVELVHDIAAAAADLGTTPYAVLATSFALWNARVRGRSEAVLAVSSANRNRPEHEDVVGLLGDAVLVRVRLGSGDFGSLVREFSTSLYAAMDHQDLPLTDVIEAVAPALTDELYPTVLFTVVTTPPAVLDLDGSQSPVDSVVVPGLARTELYVHIVAEPDDIRISWEYSNDLFDRTTVAAWDAGLRRLLERLVWTEVELPRSA